MAGLSIKQELEKIRRALRTTKKKLQDSKAELLEEMGTQLLADAQLDYLEKARGGTGKDGVTWKPNAPATIRKKNNRTSARKKDGKKTKSGRKVLPGPSSVEIGVDSGLQRASASPGYVGPDGKGGNLFLQYADSVTVGYNREYSEYFDEQRPLLPETLPAEWVQHQEEIVKDWAEKILEEGIGGI